MKSKLMYVELKSGYNGPAWIGIAHFSKSSKTVYFNGEAFQLTSQPQPGFPNYFDVETHEEYWISGVKKNGQDRHWAGSGKVFIDKKVIDEYLRYTGQSVLNKTNFEICNLTDIIPKGRINKLLNKNLQAES